jgi:protein ImuA
MAPHAMARETIFALRREIAKIEGALPERLAAPADGDMPVLRRNGRPDIASPAPFIETGAPRFDAASGGIMQAALTEVTGRETRDSGIVSGFALALAAIVSRGGRCGRTARPILWVCLADMLVEAGFPYAPGVERLFGLAPEKLLLARAGRLEDALWTAEEAARLGGFSAVFLELRGNPAKLDLTATRRLHLRAGEAGQPVFLIRHSAAPEPTAAPTRLLVSPAPSPLRETFAGPLPRSIGPPAFAVTLSKSRTGRNGTFVLEWNAHDFAFQERWSTGQRGSVREGAQAQDLGALAAASLDGQDPAPAARGGLAPVQEKRRTG